ncbi:MAG TPA: ATP-binding protein [Sphaerochaeta sp.]|jgi:MinD superfamily P-loop ATPase|nr:ATP-binding protein [Sphaerochaeta sp.]HPZ15587.1 ATP-binding protein [Sphaerochaeta sp.]
MRRLLILSGKGGTGKTTVASTFIALSGVQAWADCDVDAPNLHLVSGSFTTSEQRDYHDLPKAVIDPLRCTACNRCHEVCRFDAITVGATYTVDPIACEGCTFCLHVCPEGAITMEESKAGDLFLHTRGDQTFSTATLLMGSGTTGKLVTAVKDQLKGSGAPLAILDGSPGIGCPVIASLTGATLALMVAEPSMSGLADLKRVIASARVLQVPTAVVVNKADVNREKCEAIEAYCLREEIPFLGTIPYDGSVVELLNRGENLSRSESPAAVAIKTIWERTNALLETL